MRILLIVLLIWPCFANSENGQRESNYNSIYRSLRNYPSELLDEKGRDFFKRNRTDSALVCYTIISGRYTEDMSTAEKNQCADAYNICGQIYFLYSNYTKAYMNFHKAEEICDESVKYMAYNNIASIFFYYGDYEKSGEYLEKSYELSLKYKDWQQLIVTFDNLVNQYYLIDSLQSIENRLIEFKQLDLPKSNHYKYMMATCNGMLSVIHKNYPEAIRNFEKSIDFTDSLWMPERRAISSYFNIAKAYDAMENYDSAIVYMKKGEKIAVKYNYREIVVGAYEILSDYYEKAGNEKKSMDYKYKYLNMNDSILNAKTLGKIKDIQSSIEIEKIETKVLKLTTEQKQKNRLLAIISTALLLITFSLLWVYRQNRRLEEKNKRLFQKNLEIMASEEAEKQIRNKYETQAKDHETLISKNSPENTGIIHDDPKNSSDLLSEEDKNSLLNEIRFVMDDPGVFCLQEFTVEKLASSVRSNSKYVSLVINEKLNKNFNTFLNEYRISEARKRLLDTKQYGNLTIEAIAAELGFKSRSNFNFTFKKFTGLTPTQYLKMAKSSLNDFQK